MRAPALLLLVALSACQGIGSKANELSYAQVQAIQTGLTASQVRDAFGEPLGVARRPDGTVSRMEYAALDAKQGRARLILDFDARGVLVQRTYTGQVVRP